MTDPRVAERHRRVRRAVRRDLNRIEADTAELRRQQLQVQMNLDQAIQVEAEAWRRYDKRGSNTNRLRWENAQTARDRAENELRSVCAALRRAGRRYQETEAPDEYRRRLQQIERLDALHQQHRAGATD